MDLWIFNKLQSQWMSYGVVWEGITGNGNRRTANAVAANKHISLQSQRFEKVINEIQKEFVVCLIKTESQL